MSKERTVIYVRVPSTVCQKIDSEALTNVRSRGAQVAYILEQWANGLPKAKKR